MPKTKVLPKKEEVSEEEKIIEPDLVVPPLIDEDAVEENEDEDGPGLEDDEFDDKWEQ